MAVKLVWKDISSYSRGDQVREPTSFETRVGALKLVLTRHIHHAPTAWVLFFPPFFEGVDISHGTLQEAQEAAIAAVRDALTRALAALPEA